MTLSREPYETLEGEGFPTVRQLSVFLENRMGQLLRLAQLFENREIRILGLSVIDSIDCAVVRLLCDSPDEAMVILREAGFAVSVAEVLVVRLPHGKKGLLSVCSALLSSEINIAYTYTLMPTKMGSAIVLSVDNTEIAVDTLQQKDFEVLDEGDLPVI
ncbi:MAG: acetolactate synthase [Planctomycetota bacterium]|nr:MAG: acetolactate synthase [Planctomycetota bacterium]